MTTVATFGEIHQAQLLRSYLAAEGINATIPDELTVQNTWHLTQAIGGLRVQVPAEQAEAAEKLVAEFLNNLNQPTQHPCPRCQSKDTSNEDTASNWTLLGFVVLLLISIGIIAPLRPKYHCRSCGHVFTR